MITTLLLNVYKFKGKDIGDLRKKNPTDRFLETILPKYVLRSDNDPGAGNIDWSYGYLQFVDDGDEEFWMFDIQGADCILQEEISYGGLEELLEGFDLRKIFKNVSYINYDDFHKTIPYTTTIFIELDYQTSYDYYNGGTECDMYPYIRGYLSSDMKVIELKDEDIYKEKTQK